MLLPSCERGCVWRLLPEKGIDPVAPGAAYFGLGEVDCPDGLARCVGGVIETSEVARRPSPCHGNPEACACPWRVGPRCAEGRRCVADGLEVLAAPAAAAEQLCAPDDETLLARPARPVPASAALTEADRRSCEGETFVCSGSRVIDCRALSVALTCTKGCAPDGEVVLAGPGAAQLTASQAVAVLCVR
jgi:hypothetical protein